MVVACWKKFSSLLQMRITAVKTETHQLRECQKRVLFLVEVGWLEKYKNVSCKFAIFVFSVPLQPSPLHPKQGCAFDCICLQQIAGLIQLGNLAKDWPECQLHALNCCPVQG